MLPPSPHPKSQHKNCHEHQPTNRKPPEAALVAIHRTHPHLVHAWLSAIRGERPALPDAETSANWTMVGLCAHESALKVGEKIVIPIL